MQQNVKNVETFYDRVEQIAAHYQMKTYELLERCHIPYGTFRSARFRESDPQLRTIMRIIHLFPRVRIEWLISGEGDMLLPDPNIQVESDNAEIKQLKKQIEKLKALLLEKEQRIIELELRLSE